MQPKIVAYDSNGMAMMPAFTKLSSTSSARWRNPCKLLYLPALYVEAEV